MGETTSLSEYLCDQADCTTIVYSALNRSPNRIANCVLAAVHSLCGIFQFRLTPRKTQFAILFGERFTAE